MHHHTNRAEDYSCKWLENRSGGTRTRTADTMKPPTVLGVLERHSSSTPPPRKETTVNMQRVQVGTYRDGEFVGEVVEFTGRKVDLWEGVASSIDSNDQFTVTLRLYECPEGYRVLGFLNPISPGREAESSLYPPVGHLGYGTYTWQEVEEKWGDRL